MQTTEEPKVTWRLAKLERERIRCPICAKTVVAPEALRISLDAVRAIEALPVGSLRG